MARLFTTCPKTGRKIWTGIEIDVESFARMPDFVARVRCPFCNIDHNWSRQSASIAGDEDANPTDSDKN